MIRRGGDSRACQKFVAIVPGRLPVFHPSSHTPSGSVVSYRFARDLVRKPVPTFRDHARANAPPLRVFLSAPESPSLFSLPSESRGDGAPGGAPLSSAPWECGAPHTGGARPPALHRGGFRLPGSRFSSAFVSPSVSEPVAGVVVPRAGPRRRPGSVFARHEPQAPHPAPPSDASRWRPRANGTRAIWGRIPDRG